MSDDLKTVLFGKTAKVTLADGKEYIVREPSIEVLENINFSVTNMSDLKNIKKLAFVMLKEDNNLNEIQVGKLITFSMLNEKSEFLKTLFSVLGIKEEDKKNEMGAAS